VQLVVGLMVFGIALALTVEGAVGAGPWTVFHQGVADRVGLSIGTIVVITGVSILAILWLLNEPLGVGTIANATVIGPVVDATLWAIPDLDSIWARLPLIAIAPVVLGIGSSLYLGAGVGPGPRDGVMTALSRRGVSTWVARTGIEITALAVGWLLGGTVGLGTVWMAITTGPSVQFFLPWFRLDTNELPDA